VFTCTFDGTSSTKETSYAWTFGDGGTGSGAVVTHTFAASRNYTVTLITQPPGDHSTTSKTIKCNLTKCQ